MKASEAIEKVKRILKLKDPHVSAQYQLSHLCKSREVECQIYCNFDQEMRVGSGRLFSGESFQSCIDQITSEKRRISDTKREEDQDDGAKPKKKKGK